MDAHVRVMRLLPALGWMVLTGCTGTGGGFQSGQGLLPSWMNPATIARGQAPDEPRAPEGPLTVIPLPTPPVETPSAPETVPVNYSSTASQSASDILRERQVRIAAYIGTSTVITDDEVWMMVRQRGREFADVFGSDLEQRQKLMYREELRKLIERELVILEMFNRLRKNMGPAADGQIEKMTGIARNESERIIETIRRLNKIPTEEDFVRVLKNQQITFKTFKRQHEREGLKNMYLREVLKDKEKFVTLNDLWEHYTSNPKEYGIEDQVKWLDLFVAYNRFANVEEAKNYADSVWRQASSGADFVALVKQYGHGDSNLRDGDGVGTKRGEIQPPELEEVLFEMDAGQLSPLLKTATGFHIVKVVHRQKAGMKEFDQKVQNEIREKLSHQMREREYRVLVDDLWRKYRPKAVEE